MSTLLMLGTITGLFSETDQRAAIFALLATFIFGVVATRTTPPKANPTTTEGRVVEALWETAGRVFGNWGAYIVPNDKFSEFYNALNSRLGGVVNLDTLLMAGANVLPALLAPALAAVGVRVNVEHIEGMTEGFIQRLLTNRATYEAKSAADQEKDFREYANEAAKEAKDKAAKKDAPATAKPEQPRPPSFFVALAKVLERMTDLQKVLILRAFARDMASFGDKAAELYGHLRELTDITPEVLAGVYGMMCPSGIILAPADITRMRDARRQLLRAILTPPLTADQKILSTAKLLLKEFEKLVKDEHYLELERWVQASSASLVATNSLFEGIDDPRPIAEQIEAAEQAELNQWKGSRWYWTPFKVIATTFERIFG